MTTRQKLAPLTDWTERDFQNWCIEHPFVELCTGEYIDTCLVATIVRSRGVDVSVGCEHAYHWRFFGYLPFKITLSKAAEKVVRLFTCVPAQPITVIDAASRMWPEVFAEEARRLIEQVPPVGGSVRGF